MIKQFFGSIFRTFGRIIAYIIIAIVLFLLFGKNVNAMSYSGIDSVMSTSYSTYYEGIVSKLPYNYQYVALTYNCSSYDRNCYVLCFGEDIKKSCEYLKFNYVNNYGYQLEKGTDTSFNYTGNLLYGNINNSMASLDKGGKNYEGKTQIIALSSIFMFFVLYVLFNRKR